MLRIALDLDDCIFDFLGEYKKKFKADKNPRVMENAVITKNVCKLRLDKEFWENLPVIERPNFEPHIYCTKRINPKSYTRNCLIKNDLPVKPIYQVYTQSRNKADLIKGRCDVLIDDSVNNVLACIRSGVPALLIDRPHNQWWGPMYRIYGLDVYEIEDAYNYLIKYV